MIFAGSPLWLDFVLRLAICAAGFELGRLGGRRALARAGAGDGAPDDSDGLETYAISGVFGLLALLMAFSFGMALDRYEERRALVVAEANALGTFASRVELLEPADAAAVRALLAKYGAARLTFGNVRGVDALDEAFRKGDALHARIGALIYASLARTPPDPRGPALLQPYNEAGDLAAERLAAREARLPDPVLALLVLFCVAGATLLGYHGAAQRRTHRTASLVFLALLAIAFITVLDLDRPRGGAILVPQEAMVRQVEALQAAAVRGG